MESSDRDRIFERAVEVLRTRIDDSAPQAILDTYALGLLHLGRARQEVEVPGRAEPERYVSFLD